MSLAVSIIIPVLNEGDSLPVCLDALQSFRQYGHELIVVDGGSKDDSLNIAKQYADTVVTSAAGRARQMNRGAEMATGDILLFLHADTGFSDEAFRMLTDLVNNKAVWGRFDVRLSGPNWLFRVIESMMNLRSRFTGIVTGDQCLFVGRELFESIGGFPEIAIMEDVAISKVLKRTGRPVCLHSSVITSSRRWETNGIVSTVLLMWSMRLLYFFGASPERLSRMYR